MNDAELKILRRYASGGEPKTIAEEFKLDLEQVAQVLSGVNFQRGRATQVLREHDAATRPRAASSRTETTVALATQPAANNRHVPTKTADRPADPATQPVSLDVRARTDVEAILARADTAGGKYATRANRVRVLVDELRRDLDAAAEAIAAEREVDRIRQQLAEATAKLRALKKPPAKPTKQAAPAAQPRTSDPGEIRRWAAEQGVECPRYGKIPAAVREAYERRAA